MQEEPAMEASIENNALAIELEAVTRLGLQKLDHILRLPTDPGNGNILRAQTTAAATAVNAQLRADETKMKQVQKADFMPRLLELIEIEEAKLAEMDRAKLEKDEMARELSQPAAMVTATTAQANWLGCGSSAVSRRESSPTRCPMPRSPPF
jgi:hypothetical protein